jgi:SAM-dependent methyltransferase
MPETHDKSNGYEQVADAYSSRRQLGIGVAAVREWAGSLARGAGVLDLGCGNGAPISATLIQEGCLVYGVDASPRMVAAFRARFPDVPVACEAIEDSSFFDREFDGVIAWGVLFLLSVETQALVIRRVARVLTTGGSFLFTSPSQVCSWPDALTDRTSVSPGAEAYRRMLAAEGLTVVRELQDEGGNHYYMSVKA